MSVPITRDGPYAAPYAYKLAAGESWQAFTISAVWDGTSASGSFYPCCSIYTQDGKLVSRDFPSTAVAQGAGAEVTYHPFLRTSTSATPPAAATAPSVATFYRSANVASDPPQTIGAGATANLTWPHAALPSDGSITGPFFGSTYATVNIDCMADVWLRVGWEDGAYEKAAVLGTDSRIVPADAVTASSYMAADSPLNQDGNDWTTDQVPSSFLNGDLLHAYAVNGDASPRDINEAWLVIRVWPAPGYTGNIPRYPE